MEGRVEVCNAGEWGTVCDDFWGTVDASVVCAQLGYGPGMWHVYVGLHYYIGTQIKYIPSFTTTATSAPRFAAFGEGTGPIVFDNVQCVGTEASLFDCPNSGVGVHNFAHSEDASAVCSGLKFPNHCKSFDAVHSKHRNTS